MVVTNSTVTFTSIKLASDTPSNKSQSTQDILKQIESTIKNASQQDKYHQEEFDTRVLGRVSEYEAACGGRALPHQRLPKVSQVLLGRYQAARRNVLLLGAIQQVSQPNAQKGSKSNATTHRAHPGSESVLETTSLEADSLAGTVSHALGSFDRIKSDAGGTFLAEASQTSIGTSQTGRRLQQQGSGRSYTSSYTSASGALSQGRFGQEASSTSLGGGEPSPRRPGKPKPGRVAVALAEYGSKDDWLSKTILKHYLASIIQARWRGYSLRRRWADDKHQVVAEEKAKNQAEETNRQRVLEMLIAPELTSVAGSRSMVKLQPLVGRAQLAAGEPSGTEGQSRLNQSLLRPPGTSALPGPVDTDSDSGWSDVEVDDVASIKTNAYITPPWQKPGQHSQMSQRLRHRAAVATAATLDKPMPEPSEFGLNSAELGGGLLGVLWDSSSDECSARLQQVS
eukprot:gene8740-8920_t